MKTQLQNRTAGRLQSWFQNLRTTYKFKLPHLTEGGTDQAAASENKTKQNKTKQNTTQPSGETTRELLLKYQNQDWMLEEKQQNLN
jgi:hypothetical protein